MDFKYLMHILMIFKIWRKLFQKYSDLQMGRSIKCVPKERIMQKKYNEYEFIMNNEIQTLTRHILVITQLS